ncbi:MAG: chaperone protein ClpB [Chloroflexota bacterium]|nr:ATP-dependent Clp protease ATP-binding subunit [Chloroflexota bacterium]GIK65077.1 MAG: chaperone protein ClpB [Chloroflexota bacterium]
MRDSSHDMSEMEIRQRCGELLQKAQEEATRLKHGYIGTEHIFNALTRNPSGITNLILTESGLDPREVRNSIRKEVGGGDDEETRVPILTPRARHILAESIYLADDVGSILVEEEHVLLAMLQEGEGVPIRKLKQMGVAIQRWVEYLMRFLDIEGKSDDSSNEKDLFGDLMDHRDFGDLMEPDNERVPGRAMPTPLLDKYGRDLTEQARLGKLGPAVGRDTEIRAVARTLTRSKKNNPLLVGDAGVGKTAIIEGLAWQIANDTAPGPLKNKRIVQIEVGMLVAGTSLRGQFEERLGGIVEEARSSKDVILFIDEIHTIVGAGDTIDSNLDAANILKPALARGDISCIGATTFEEYRKAIAKDPALDRRFRTIDIGEPTIEDTLIIIENVYKRYEEHHHVTILPEAREQAVKLSAKYLTDRRLPDKALDLLDEACARIVIQTHSPDEEDEPVWQVTAQTIHEVLSEWTGIPVAELRASERERYLKINETLSKRVRGQEHAVKTLGDTIKRHRAGLSDPRRPVGVFLFLGPSGVGKTELARALADFLFGNEKSMIRLDMSEFHDEHTVSRLIGAPPGYKGTERGGQLTEALRRKPYSVVLLDEVEKAAPQVFDVFLQVFDEGRLTDSLGATVDARHAVWIMTSNIGTGDVGKGIGFVNKSDGLPDYSFHLKKFFRPEFLNRLDELVIFNPLDKDTLNEILELQMADVMERLDAQELSLELDVSARELLLNEGYSPANGARPLRRVIERLLTRPLSSALIENAYQPGDKIRVVADGDTLKLEHISRAEHAAKD